MTAAVRAGATADAVRSARSPTATVVVTGWSLHLPDAAPPDGMATDSGRPAGEGAGAVGAAGGSALPAAVSAVLAALLVPAACRPEAAAAVLGRKGLLHKEPATRLALCAVHRALGLEPRLRPHGLVDPRTAVVACGNLGNVETVARVARDVRAGGVREVSPLAAPNASSNVVASTVALWFGFGGPNLMVCSGATAGLDGLALACRLLRADRADRVVLVGAEPADEVATALHTPPEGIPVLRGGAACVLLGRATDPAAPGGRTARQDGSDGPEGVDGVDGPDVVTRAAGPDGAAPADAVDGPLVLVDPAPVPADRAGAQHVPFRVGSHGPDGPAADLDPATAWGDTYGAAGVVSLVVAAAVVAAGAADAVEVSCGDAADGWRRAEVRARSGGPAR